MNIFNFFDVITNYSLGESTISHISKNLPARKNQNVPQLFAKYLYQDRTGF